MKIQGKWAATLSKSNAESREVATGLDFRWRLARLQEDLVLGGGGVF